MGEFYLQSVDKSRVLRFFRITFLLFLTIPSCVSQIKSRQQLFTHLHVIYVTFSGSLCLKTTGRDAGLLVRKVVDDVFIKEDTQILNQEKRQKEAEHSKRVTSRSQSIHKHVQRPKTCWRQSCCSFTVNPRRSSHSPFISSHLDGVL